MSSARIRSLIKETALYGIPGVVSRSMGLLLLPVLTNILPPEQFGHLKLTYILIGPILLFMVFGMGTSLVRHLIGADDKSGIFSTHFWPLFLVSTVLAALVAVFAGPLAELYFADSQPGDVNMIRLASLILWLDALNTLPFSVLRAENRPVMYLSTMLCSTVVYAAGVVLLLWWADLGVEGVLLSNVAGSTTAFLMFIPLFRRYLAPHFNRALFGVYFAFGFPIIFSSLGKSVMDMGSRLILEHLKDATAVAYFSAGFQIGALANLAVAAFTMAWKPFLVRVSTEPDAERTYAKVMTFSMVLLCAMMLAVSLLADDLMKMEIFGITLMGREYWPGLKVVPLVMVSYIFYGAYVNLSVGCDLMRKTQYFAWTTGAAAVLNVVFCFLLIPSMGMMGAAWATFIAYVFQAVFLYVLVQRIYSIRYEWGRLTRLALLTALFYFAAELSGASIVVVIGLLAMYSAALFMFRVLDTASLRSIRPGRNR